MKIGAFAQHNKVGIDTVRHYMGLELLLPRKKGGQYDFDVQCQKDFEEILFLKTLGFSLQEIKNLFVLRRLGKMTSIQQGEYYKKIFRDRYDVAAAEIEKLSREKSRLEEELRRLDQDVGSGTFKMGLDLSVLPRLACDHCGGPLTLKEAAVEENCIRSGRLGCSCGTEYSVRDGILFTGAEQGGKDQIPDILTYIRNTDEEYLHRIYRTLEWNVQNIDFRGLAGKVILEPGSGSGFFLRRIYDDLPDDALYIAVDHNPEALYFLKNLMEQSGKRKNVLFICADFLQVPLKHRSADVICDFSGSSNYAFDHQEFLLREMERYFTPDAVLYGSYITFGKFSPTGGIPADYRANFRIDEIRRQIEKLGFTARAEDISEPVTKGGIYENYFSDGESIRNYSFVGKRSG